MSKWIKSTKKLTELPICSVSDGLPEDPYDWVFVLQEKESFVVAQIARCIKGKWEFLNTNDPVTEGPARGDMTEAIHADKITHWIPIPWDLDIYDEEEDE